METSHGDAMPYKMILQKKNQGQTDAFQTYLLFKRISFKAKSILYEFKKRRTFKGLIAPLKIKKTN